VHCAGRGRANFDAPTVEPKEFWLAFAFAIMFANRRHDTPEEVAQHFHFLAVKQIITAGLAIKFQLF
jgi:hypothetical protein